MKRILIIDDEQDICTLLKRFFQKKGFEVDTSLSGKEGIKSIQNGEFDLVICDFRLPDHTGLEILERIKILQKNLQVIIITGYSDVRIAVEALKKGAFDYVTKPLFPDEILHTVNRALAGDGQMEVKPKAKRKKSSKRTFVTGTSHQSKTARKHIELIAPTDLSVIVSGETGTGKEFVARSIHEKSKRSGNPFVAVDCGALPKELAASELFGHVKGAFTGAISDKKGCFELASGGTLFLDEIGNLTYENQIKLLRVLQERVVKKVGGSKDISVDVRVIAATNEDLKAAVNSGDFREDLYHRLNEFSITLAPLRERKEDIVTFSRHFLIESNERLDKNIEDFDSDVLEILRSYHWYGNLRELGNVIRRSVLLSQGKKLTAETLPEEIKNPEMDAKVEGVKTEFYKGKTLKEVVAIAEEKAIRSAMEITDNNKSEMARLLGVDRKTLYNKLKSHRIDFQ
ncbi:sigma-54-dependent transcriptional regulator [Algoriphagus sediminis]|uniref:Sigma-54 dependent transcriptional regulator n=1 Tax=Algoriphagus sediminis TaxID=3057113 RepID=A0ABT7YFH5_9BACT|nr:sigma-54 dependent transcriptional regulator [Algoriphagus sediminis]MDN3205226.1 sigma-54 dependent transcriptional regulator [Algoriphagus sediminis]